MAINYPDYMPNYTMGETEEERRRREKEETARAAGQIAPVQPVAPISIEPVDLANTEVQSTQVKTYGDGSQEEIVKRQIPAEQPVAPVQPEMQPAPQPEVQAQPQMTPAPQVQAQPQMTPAPQAQAPVGPQRTTDPAELQRRQEVMRNMMAQSQQAPAPPAQASAPTQAIAPTQMPDIGQPPVPGPGVQVAGPAAMPPAPAAPAAVPAPAANLQQVAAQMGATPTAAPAPTFDSRFAEASTDPGKLLELRKDESLTKPQRQLAGRQIQQILEQELGPLKANDQIGSMTENDLARVLKSKSQEGSWVKLALLGFISPELAGKEAAKLGLNDKWEVGSTTEGKSILYKTRDGVPLEGYDSITGKSMSAKELLSSIGSAPGKLKPDVSMQDVEKDGMAGRVATLYDKNNRPRTVVLVGNKEYPYDTTWKSRDISKSATKDTFRTTLDLAKKFGTNVLDAEKQYEIDAGPFGSKTNPMTREDFRAQYNFSLNQVPGVSTGTTTTPAATDTTTTPAATPPAATPPAATGTTTTPVTLPSGGGGGGGGGGGKVSLGAVPQRKDYANTTAFNIAKERYEAQQKLNNDIAAAAAKEKIQTGETIPREFIKLNSAAAAEAAKASANAPQLLSTLDRITNTLERRPDFANALQSPAFTAFVVAQGADTQKRLQDLSDTARIDPRDKTDFQNLVNDLRRLEVAGITQSGLSASQLNTERESQRVVDALAISLRNTPQAARTQAEIARAQIQYQRRFAQYLASADPTQNPAAIRNRFDDTIGDKIYNDLVPKLEAIKRGGVVDFRSNQ